MKFETKAIISARQQIRKQQQVLKDQTDTVEKQLKIAMKALANLHRICNLSESRDAIVRQIVDNAYKEML